MRCPNCRKRIPRKSIYCMYCGVSAGRGAALSAGGQAPRRCILCGRSLPEESISDVCLSCLHGRDFSSDEADEPPLPDFEEAPPIPAERPQAGKKRRGLIAALSAAAAIVLLLLCLLPRVVQMLPQSRSGGASGTAPLSETQRLAAGYAHEMVRAAAYDPASLHYSSRTLAVAEADGSFTVTQEFTRNNPQRGTVTEPFEAVLTLKEAGFTPLCLRIGEELIYDYRA